MSPKFLDRLLSQLEEYRFRFDPAAGQRVISLLRKLDAAPFTDAHSLIRFHEALMFLRAFPQSPPVLRKTETLLNNFYKRVLALRNSGADMSAFSPLEVSGIAGTEMSDTLSFDVAGWLVRRAGASVLHKRDRTRVSDPGLAVEVDWDEWDEGRAMASTLPRFLPLLEDDAFVEADTPWPRWIEVAADGSRDATAHQRLKTSKCTEWLIRQFEGLPVSDRDRAELYDSLRVPLRWKLGNSRVSRTRNWYSPADPVSRAPASSQRIFYHREPLITRSRVSLADELAKKSPRLVKLPRHEGKRVIDKIREIMLVRYRELYGTTLGDPASVVLADLGGDEFGRGLSIYLWNLPPERRLPLRAYVAGFTLKSGVPINYIEAIGLSEWMEVGFNTFYTFRGGEAAWVYAQVLRCLTHLMGTRCISVYPYQLGQDNDEAVESGAFWFYRKLGFRPGQPELLRLVEREEKKITANPKYRTPAHTLKKLASGHVFYELPDSEPGAWDRFSSRNIGLRLTERMARDFGGDHHRMRHHSTLALERILRVRTRSWSALERSAFENFSLVLSDVRDLTRWTGAEKQQLVELIRSKAAREEMSFLHLSQRHSRLRKALLKIGSLP